MELEQITRDKSRMCINHYRAKTNLVITDEDLRHANCSGFNYECPEYRPSREFYVILNKGKPALIFR